jgi:subtilisin-like proprotein convertase family protein
VCRFESREAFPAAIPDGGGATAAIQRSAFVLGGGTGVIKRMKVCAKLTHPHLGDLVITLALKKQGVLGSCTLTDRSDLPAGSEGARLAGTYCWSNAAGVEAPLGIATLTDADGQLLADPKQAYAPRANCFGLFTSGPAAGRWLLEVKDVSQGGGGGAGAAQLLEGFSVTFMDCAKGGPVNEGDGFGWFANCMP